LSAWKSSSFLPIWEIKQQQQQQAAGSSSSSSSSNPRGISLLSNPARAVSSTSMQAGTKGQQQQQQKAGNAT